MLSTYGRRAFAVAGPTVWNSFGVICLSLLVTKCTLKTILVA